MTETQHCVIKAFNKSFCHKIKENKEKISVKWSCKTLVTKKELNTYRIWLSPSPRWISLSTIIWNISCRFSIYHNFQKRIIQIELEHLFLANRKCSKWFLCFLLYTVLFMPSVQFRAWGNPHWNKAESNYCKILIKYPF